MSITNVIVGIAIGLVLGALLIAFRRQYRDVLPVLLVGGVCALAVVVTIYWVAQYRASRHTASATAASQPAFGFGSSAPPPARRHVAFSPQGIGGATGAAAPLPYARGSGS